jgi:hypothetical protein
VALSRVDAPKKSQFYALASIAIVLALLYFGQEVLIPLALAGAGGVAGTSAAGAGCFDL